MTTAVERPHPPPTADSRATFIDVYRASYRQMVQIARLTTGSNALAEELVQDAFADLYGRFDDLRKPDAYLRRAVLNRCTSWVRRRVVERRHQQRSPDKPPAWTDADTATVMDALSRLSTPQRAVIVMRYLADWSESEIANALGCRPGTVKSRLARARNQLAKELTRDN